jgi:Rieske Fe-S protein
MNRRIFVAAGLALLGFGRRTWAQLANPSSPIRYASLTRAVTIPVDAVATPWRPVPFVAESTASGRRVLISGLVFRTDTELSALCVTCPHEQCQVELITDGARLATMAGGKATHPLFECGCHFSLFDAANDGARISGETPRGLYRFRIGSVHDGLVEITGIEDVALSEV